MKEILIAISLLSIKIGEQNQYLTNSQIENQWLGFDSAKNETITEVEKRLNIILPKDYKDFIKMTNGFSAPDSVEPNFSRIEDIDYLKNIDKEAIESYQLPELKNSILIAGKEDEQYFLLIPPDDKTLKWRYWKFANWLAGEQEFDNLESYFKYVLNFCENNID